MPSGCLSPQVPYKCLRFVAGTSRRWLKLAGKVSFISENVQHTCFEAPIETTIVICMEVCEKPRFAGARVLKFAAKLVYHKRGARNFVPVWNPCFLGSAKVSLSAFQVQEMVMLLTITTISISCGYVVFKFKDM